MKFHLQAPFQPAGDQGPAISKILRSFSSDHQSRQTLLGVTGSGKTFTMASVITELNIPVLVLTHNKTLAAQLYREFKNFFPDNAVEYFVSYYNYYQPEAYIPTTDTYIEKDASINDEIDRLRLRATSSLLSRNDTIIIASVSCIFGLGSPQEYRESTLFLHVGEQTDLQSVLKKLIVLQYTRNDITLTRGMFSVRGEILEIFPAYGEEIYRVVFFGDKVEEITFVNAVTGDELKTLEQISISAAKHFITSPKRLNIGMTRIYSELEQRLHYFETQNKLLEKQRLESRVQYDMEMLKQIGYCNGIENYSRHLSGREEGEPPACLIDYFPEDYLIVIDESHVTLPQIRGMYEGDRSRKQTLVNYGFRLPSALDNRPLNFGEFDNVCRRVLYVSATPSDWEVHASKQVVRQIIRPTGLLDPIIHIRSPKNQIADLQNEINKRTQQNQRTLVTTLTKKMAEDLCDYYLEAGLKTVYLHSEIKTIERVEILRDLRRGIYDVLIGVNLLREGLDIPEVSLVAILDADKEGFLRNERSLIQTIGRAARNIHGTAILYAHSITDSIKKATEVTNRRRKLQQLFNSKHNITPKTIQKQIENIIDRTSPIVAEENALSGIQNQLDKLHKLSPAQKVDYLREQMLNMAKALEFEKAALLRDQIDILTNKNTASKKTRTKAKAGKVVAINSPQKRKKTV